MITPVIGRPGIQSGSTVSYRQVFRLPESVLYLPGGGIIAAAAQDPGNTGSPLTLRAGLPMGRVAATKKWLPSLMGLVDTAYASGTSLTLTTAAAAELVRRVGSSGTFKLTGPPSANGTARTLTVTFSAVDTGTGVVTITALPVNEVQTLTFGAAATGGTMRLRVPKADGTMVTTDAITWNATDATWLAAINTALDGATGVVGGIVATGAAPDTAITFTFSGTGYAALPQPTEMISVVAFPTSATTATVVRTTTGVAGAFVAGSWVQPTDGSETPRTVIPDGSGLTMVTANAADVDFPQIAYHALIQTSGFAYWPSDTGLRAWIVAAMQTGGVRFEFDHLTANA